MNVYFPSAETDSAKQSINVDRARTQNGQEEVHLH